MAISLSVTGRCGRARSETFLHSQPPREAGRAAVAAGVECGAGWRRGWQKGGTKVAARWRPTAMHSGWCLVYLRLVPGLLAVKIKHTERRGLLILATLPAAWEQAHLKF